MSDSLPTKTGAGWASDRGLVGVMIYMTPEERDELKAAAKASEHRHVSPYARAVLAAAARRARRARRKQVDETPPENL